MPPPPLQHITYILQHAQMRLDPNLKIENDSLKEPFSKYRHDSERVAVFYIIQVGVGLSPLQHNTQTFYNKHK